jgi:hypothetical protein
MQVAKEMKLDFFERDEFGLMEQLRIFENYPLFTPVVLLSGTSIKNIVVGELDGTEVFLFDHKYHIRRNGNSVVVNQTVFAANVKDHEVPGFRYRHDRWYQMKLINRHRMPGMRGEIVFREELVRQDETEELVRSKLIPELQALLTAENPANIEVLEGYLLVYRPETLLGTEDAISFYQNCCAITNLLQSNQGQKSVYRWAEIQEKDY